MKTYCVGFTCLGFRVHCVVFIRIYCAGFTCLGFRVYCVVCGIKGLWLFKAPKLHYETDICSENLPRSPIVRASKKEPGTGGGARG